MAAPADMEPTNATDDSTAEADQVSRLKRYDKRVEEWLASLKDGACRIAGVPTFSPHDLRHRRVSLMHEQGVSWARIGEAVGHGDIVTTARTYTHGLGDASEVSYEPLLSDNPSTPSGLSDRP